jgi:hypothetical protein
MSKPVGPSRTAALVRRAVDKIKRSAVTTATVIEVAGSVTGGAIGPTAQQPVDPQQTTGTAATLRRADEQRTQQQAGQLADHQERQNEDLRQRSLEGAARQQTTSQPFVPPSRQAPDLKAQRAQRAIETSAGARQAPPQRASPAPGRKRTDRSR